MSIMLLEAAYVNTPIICSDIPENKAIFSSDEVLFFKSKDEEDLKDKIEFALNNGDQMKEKTIRAFDVLKNKYNWEQIAIQYDELFQRLI
jgi:glycosyltransferase involved in cell wall biosynthesis